MIIRARAAFVRKQRWFAGDSAGSVVLQSDCSGKSKPDDVSPTASNHSPGN